MHMYFGSPSATEMTMDLLFDVPSVVARSQCWRLLLAVWLLASVSASSPMQCKCWNVEGHTYRCVGCSRLPLNVPTGVTSLRMAGNRVSNIHFVSSRLANLKTIYLNNNSITSLYTSDLCPLKSLMVLDLSANNLESFDEDSIACNDQLKKLVLDDNPQIQLVVLRSQSLERLSLRNCGLTSFDPQLLRRLRKLRELDLSGNDALPCGQVTQDLHKYWPRLRVLCDVQTSATKNTSTAATTTTTTASSAGLPPHSQDDIVQKIQLVAPIPVVPLVVILAVVLAAVLFSLCKRSGHDFRPGVESGDGKLLEEPC
ncbi:amphoterin-induced protein 1-like [Schistocerca cancellata]|uniref:amphoterin-induced protein 1-like n=1 Tax=Schistocerca cancellata TaxID=274614 RepID=UPI002119A604|nr:amphoterin-induced protein 1-like [Schistocerca cancellata]XP_049765687.1 amphoterin-induced protein 1-like [Schistocerca cancellata]